MRAIAISFLLLVSMSIAQQPAKVPIAVTLSAPQSEYAVGQPIKIDITVQNTSDKEISVAQSNATGKAELSYEIDVLDSRGRRVPYLRYGKQLHGEDPTGAIFDSQKIHHLQPHEVLSDSAVLNTIYNLSSPGQYLVQVKKKKFPGVEPDKPVASNPIKITIVKPAS
jgi:hypothetical protein